MNTKTSIIYSSVAAVFLIAGYFSWTALQMGFMVWCGVAITGLVLGIE